MRDINFAFNWFYADDRDIAWTLSGWYPKRAKGTHPDLPAWGTGEWDWQGFDTSDYSSKRISVTRLPHGAEPGAGLPRQLEQQAGAGLAGRGRLLELRVDPAHDAARGPDPRAGSAAAASSTWPG